MKCHLSDMRQITSKFLELPRQAIECCLSDFEDIVDLPDTTREKLEMFIEDTNRDTMEYKVVIKRSTPKVYVVDLTDDAKELSVSLSVYKLAMPRRNNYNNKSSVKSTTEVEKPPRTAPTNRAANWSNAREVREVREVDGAETQERFNEAADRQKERFANKNQNTMDSTRYERPKPKNDVTKSPMNNGASRNYGNR